MSILAFGLEVVVCDLCEEPGQKHHGARSPVSLPRAPTSCALEGPYITPSRLGGDVGSGPAGWLSCL